MSDNKANLGNAGDITRELLRENERNANRFIMTSHMGILFIMGCLLISYYFQSSPSDYALTRSICYCGGVCNLIGIIAYRVLGPESRILKHILLGCWSFMATVVAGLCGANETFAFFFPVALSVRYFQPRLTIKTMLVLIPLLFVSRIINVFWGYPDVGLLALPENLTVNFGDETPDVILLAINWDRWGTFLNLIQWQLPTAILSLIVQGIFLTSTAKIGLMLMLQQSQRNLEKRLAEVEEFKSDIAAYLLNAKSLSDGFDYVINRLCEFTKAGWVSIQQAGKPENCWISDSRTEADLSVCAKCPLNGDRGLEYFDEEGMFVLSDVAKQDKFSLPEACPAKSIMSCILKVEGERWGAMALHYLNKPVDFTRDDRYVLRMVAELLESVMERNRMEAQLMRERDNAIAAERSKTLFFANVSHDIRTPLNAILGFTELLRIGEADEETSKKYLESISLSGNTLLQLLNDVLDLSKLEAGKMQFQMEVCDFRKLGDEMMTAFAAQAEKKGLRMRTEYAKDIPVVEIALLRARQILFNLLGNALKFTEKGEVVLQASFTPANGEVGTLSFSVKDTGRGISKEDISKLMRPFVQVKIQDQASGTGLGLAICRSMLEQMNGRLSIESEEGKGSVFTVVLDNVKYFHESADGKMPLTAVETPRTVTKKEFSKMSVLLVDDSPVNISVIRAMLKHIGVTNVSSASNGQEAIDALKKGAKYDFVLSDLWMPVMNGVELAETVSHENALKDIPVVLVTADVDAEKNYSAKGVSKIILKPVTVEKLRDILNS